MASTLGPIEINKEPQKGNLHKKLFKREDWKMGKFGQQGTGKR